MQSNQNQNPEPEEALLSAWEVWKQIPVDYNELLRCGLRGVFPTVPLNFLLYRIRVEDIPKASIICRN